MVVESKNIYKFKYNMSKKMPDDKIKEYKCSGSNIPPMYNNIVIKHIHIDD